MDYFVVDAFTDVAFAGNPAAVAIVDYPLDEAWCQGVAAEMNLSETAFVSSTGPVRELRWFTPTVEVPLCGHATLASAHVLFGQGMSGTLRFSTRSGELAVSREGEMLAMDFPELTPGPPIEVPGLAEALRARPVATHEAGRFLLVELADERAVRSVAPDLGALAEFGRSVIVTAPGGGSDVDFVSRMFAPASGIPEDPVTGSAHCALAPFWAARTGRYRLVGYQASRRGGRVGVGLSGGRVTLYGTAVTVATGTFLISSAATGTRPSSRPT